MYDLWRHFLEKKDGGKIDKEGGGEVRIWQIKEKMELVKVGRNVGWKGKVFTGWRHINKVRAFILLIWFLGTNIVDAWTNSLRDNVWTEKLNRSLKWNTNVGSEWTIMEQGIDGSWNKELMEVGTRNWWQLEQRIDGAWAYKMKVNLEKSRMRVGRRRIDGRKKEGWMNGKTKDLRK